MAGTVEADAAGTIHLEFYVTEPQQLDKFEAGLPSGQVIVFLRNKAVEAKANGWPIEGPDTGHLYYRVVSNQGVIRAVAGNAVLPADGGSLTGVDGETFDAVVAKILPTAGADVMTVATMPPGSTSGDALAGGPLGAKRREGVVCWWVSQGSARMALVWPSGFSTADGPLRIIGPDGQRLAVVGDVVELGGGAPPVGYVPSPDLDPCGVGSLYFVSVVGTVNGQRVDVGEGSLTLTSRSPDPHEACPEPFLGPAMLVMSDGRLRLRIGGRDVDASWPASLSALPGDRIHVVDYQGGLVMVQGVSVSDVRGIDRRDLIDVCGFGATIYP